MDIKVTKFGDDGQNVNRAAIFRLFSLTIAALFVFGKFFPKNLFVGTVFLDIVIFLCYDIRNSLLFFHCKEINYAKNLTIFNPHYQ